jgi:alpha-beta hydrolase superfamily lysophospholipase
MNYKKEIIFGKSEQSIQVSYFWEPKNTGPNKTILILPGLDESYANYQDFIAELRIRFPTYSILAIDLRGQGKTLDNEVKVGCFTITIENQIAIIREITKSLPIESIFIIGLSYGAGIALCTANQVSKVEGLALLAPYVTKFKNYRGGFVGMWYTLVHLNPFYKPLSRFSLPIYFRVARDRGLLNNKLKWTRSRVEALTKLTAGIMKISTTKEAQHLKDLPKGVHFFIGDDDEVVSIRAVEHLFKEIRCENKTIYVGSKLSHRLLIQNHNECSEWVSKILK